MADLEFTRRSLLIGLAALLAAPVKAVLPSVPEIAHGARHWMWVHASGWREMPNGIDYALQMTAQRSDGQYFCTIVGERLEDLQGPSHLVTALVEQDIKQSKFVLDSFLNCDCVAGNRCTLHALPTEDPWKGEEAVA